MGCSGVEEAGMRVGVNVGGGVAVKVGGGKVTVTCDEDEEQAVRKTIRMRNRFFFMGKFL